MAAIDCHHKSETKVSKHVQASVEEKGPALHEVEAQGDAASISNQRKLLSTKRLLIAFPALSVALFVPFIDQTFVSTSIPAISRELNTGASTSWISASFLIASTAFQLINGRLSDIFGRKDCLLVCLALLGLGGLLCGFAKSKEQLFAFRALAGIGGGGVNSIVMIIVSDITALESRGKYQGILGAVLALANGTGPFIGGVLVLKASWKWMFWLVPMPALPVSAVIVVALPLKDDSGQYGAKLKKIDYGGVILNLASGLLVLIPLSGGGVTYTWNSPFFVSMLVVGIVIGAAFVMYEWKVAPIPIMPMRLLNSSKCACLYGQSFFSGICFFGNFFYLPIYFQNVLRYSPLESGALILPLTILTSIFSILAGQYMSRFGRYLPSIALGFGLWTLGAGLLCHLDQDSKLSEIIPLLLIEGAGIGLTLQPVLIELLANSKSEDRAVCTGLRNFIRTIGGAFGLILSGVILSNTLSMKLEKAQYIDHNMLTAMASSVNEIETYDITAAQKAHVMQVYMLGIHYIFIFYACSAGINLLLSAGAGNTDLRKERQAESSRAGAEDEK